MFLSFLKKWSSNLCLKLLSEFANFRSVGKLFQTTGVRYDKSFWPEHVFLKGCFSFKTEDLVFAWFWPDCLYISWKYRGQVSLKNLKALEQRYWLNLSDTGSQLIFLKCFSPIWLLLSSWRQYLIHLFWTVCNLLFNFLFRFGHGCVDTKLSRHNQNVVELKHYTGVVLDMVLNMFFLYRNLSQLFI